MGRIGTGTLLMIVSSTSSSSIIGRWVSVEPKAGVARRRQPTLSSASEPPCKDEANPSAIPAEWLTKLHKNTTIKWKENYPKQDFHHLFCHLRLKAPIPPSCSSCRPAINLLDNAEFRCWIQRRINWGNARAPSGSSGLVTSWWVVVLSILVYVLIRKSWRKTWSSLTRLGLAGDGSACSS